MIIQMPFVINQWRLDLLSFALFINVFNIHKELGFLEEKCFQRGMGVDGNEHFLLLQKIFLTFNPLPDNRF